MESLNVKDVLYVLVASIAMGALTYEVLGIMLAIGFHAIGAKF